MMRMAAMAESILVPNSVVVHAALVGLGVVLAELLERVGALLAVARVAGGRAELLHLVPRRHALAAHRVVGTGLLRLFDALGHLAGQIRWRGGHGHHQAAVHAHRPECHERHGVVLARGQRGLEGPRSRESDYGNRGGGRGGHGVAIWFALGRSDGVRKLVLVGAGGVAVVLCVRLLSLSGQLCGDRSATADFHSKFWPNNTAAIAPRFGKQHQFFPPTVILCTSGIIWYRKHVQWPMELS
jgi:hypothetical protein